MQVFSLATQPGLQTSVAYFSSTSKFISQLTIKLYDIVKHHFKLLEGLCLIGCSLKELLMDYLPLTLRIDKEKSYSPIQEAAKRHFCHIQTAISQQFLGRGILYGASGALRTCVSLEQLQFLDLGVSTALFTFGGLGMFLFGCFFSLERNIKILQEAQRMEELTCCIDEQKLAQRIKFSAILGILSDLSYIVSTILSLFSAGMITYIILGCFALFSTSIKNIYDFFFLCLQEI